MKELVLMRLCLGMLVSAAVAIEAPSKVTAEALPKGARGSLTQQQIQEKCIRDTGWGIQDAHGNWLGYRFHLSDIAACRARLLGGQ